MVGWAQMMGERVYLPTEPDRIYPAVGSSEESAVGVEDVAVVDHFRKARGDVEPLSLNLGNGMRIVGEFARRCPTDSAVTSGALPEFADYLVEIGPRCTASANRRVQAPVFRNARAVSTSARGSGATAKRPRCSGSGSR